MGPRFSVSSPISDKTRLTASFSAYVQDYDALSFASLEDERDNQDTYLELGLNYNNRNSNVQTNDFENFGGDIRLTVGF